MSYPEDNADAKSVDETPEGAIGYLDGGLGNLEKTISVLKLRLSPVLKESEIEMTDEPQAAPVSELRSRYDRLVRATRDLSKLLDRIDL